MKKFLFIVVVILSIAYSGSWFYLADKIKQQLILIMALENEDGGSASALSLEDIDISGFPLRLKITVVPGEYSISLPSLNKDKKNIYTIVTDGSLVLNSKIFDSTMSMQLPHYVRFVSVQDKGQNFAVSFPNKDSIVSVTMDKMFASFYFRILLDGFEDAVGSNIFGMVKGSSYSDGGMVLYHGNLNEILYTADKSSISFAIKDVKDDYKTLDFLTEYSNALARPLYYKKILDDLPKSISKTELKILEWVLSENTRSGASSAKLEFSLSGYTKKVENQPFSFILDLRQLAYNDSQYSINSAGNISLEIDEGGVPHGWYRIEITNYVRLIDYLTRYYNSLVVPSIKGKVKKLYSTYIRKINATDTEIVKRMIQYVGDLSDDRKSVSITIQKDKNQRDVIVGNRTLTQIKIRLKKELKSLAVGKDK